MTPLHPRHQTLTRHLTPPTNSLLRILVRRALPVSHSLLLLLPLMVFRAQHLAPLLLSIPIAGDSADSLPTHLHIADGPVSRAE